jgi:hypothetical protein
MRGNDEWRIGGSTVLDVAGESGWTAYVVRRGRLGSEEDLEIVGDKVVHLRDVVIPQLYPSLTQLLDRGGVGALMCDKVEVGAITVPLTNERPVLVDLVPAEDIETRTLHGAPVSDVAPSRGAPAGGADRMTGRKPLDVWLYGTRVATITDHGREIRLRSNVTRKPPELPQTTSSA